MNTQGKKDLFDMNDLNSPLHLNQSDFNRDILNPSQKINFIEKSSYLLDSSSTLRGDITPIITVDNLGPDGSGRNRNIHNKNHLHPDDIEMEVEAPPMLKVPQLNN